MITILGDLGQRDRRKEVAPSLSPSFPDYWWLLLRWGAPKIEEAERNAATVKGAKSRIAGIVIEEYEHWG
jgi:hypothetical protein